MDKFTVIMPYVVVYEKFQDAPLAMFVLRSDAEDWVKQNSRNDWKMIIIENQ